MLHDLLKDFDPPKSLGEGAYGEVWLKTYENKQYAVKDIDISALNDASREKYVYGEVKTTFNVKHHHIV
jgi:serine/threonine protein kinase